MTSYSTYSESKLIAQLRAGSHAAFAELFNRYWARLLDVAYQRLQSKEEAEEVVQEIFVSLYQRHWSLPERDSLEAYLMTAVRYKVIQVYRSREVRKRQQQVKIQNEDPVSPLDTLQWKELRQQLLEAAGRLPDRCREVFMLSRIEGLSHLEIAKRLDISVSTVKTHLNKALKILRSELGNLFDEKLFLILLWHHFFS